MLLRYQDRNLKLKQQLASERSFGKRCMREAFRARVTLELINRCRPVRRDHAVALALSGSEIALTSQQTSTTEDSSHSRSTEIHVKEASQSHSSVRCCFNAVYDVLVL